MGKSNKIWQDQLLIINWLLAPYGALSLAPPGDPFDLSNIAYNWYKERLKIFIKCGADAFDAKLIWIWIPWIIVRKTKYPWNELSSFAVILWIWTFAKIVSFINILSEFFLDFIFLKCCTVKLILGIVLCVQSQIDTI